MSVFKLSRLISIENKARIYKLNFLHQVTLVRPTVGPTAFQRRGDSQLDSGKLFSKVHQDTVGLTLGLVGSQMDVNQFFYFIHQLAVV